MKISETAIEKTRAALKKAPSLPPSDPVYSKTKTLRLLMPDIAELVDSKNYTCEQIAKLLQENGINVATSSLKSSLSQYRKIRRDENKAEDEESGTDV